MRSGEEGKKNTQEPQPSSHPTTKTGRHPASTQPTKQPDAYKQDEERKVRGIGREEQRKQIIDDETKR